MQNEVDSIVFHPRADSALTPSSVVNRSVTNRRPPWRIASVKRPALIKSLIPRAHAADKAGTRPPGGERMSDRRALWSEQPGPEKRLRLHKMKWSGLPDLAIAMTARDE